MGLADLVDEMNEDQLAAVADSDLKEMAEAAIIDSAIMQRFPRWAEPSYRREDRIYAECKRRSCGLWQQAWNAVVRSQGHGHMVQPVDKEGA